MAAEEQLVLDGLTLNDATFGLLELDMTPPRQRQEWIGAADSEWQVLARKPLHENREILCTLNIAAQSTTNLAMDKIGSILDKFRLATATPEGIDLVWTPADGTRSVTFDCLAGEIVGMPVDWAEGWLVKAPTVRLRMVCKPYWTGTEHTTVTDAFGSNTIANYTFDAGAAGNVSITGGVMDAAANLTTENRFYHSSSPYNVTSAQVTLKHTLGTTLSGYKAGVILKRVDASNYVEAYVDDTGAASRLRIDSVVATVRANLVSTALTRMTVSTAYWIRARLEGNVAFAEHWTAAPTATGAAASSNTITLAGADATALGRTVQGRAGVVWTPQQTAASLDDLEIAPNVAVSSTPFVTAELANVVGDITALGTMTMTERAAQSRRHVEFGVEGQYYNSATSLLIDSDSMVTSGFTGTQTTKTGAYDPNAAGNAAISCALITTAVSVCGTGDQTHAGTFVVKGRLLATTDDVEARLSWQAADGPWTNNPWVRLNGGDFWEERELGAITIPAVTSGTQRWTGKIQARTTTGADTVYVDYLELIPTGEGYGVARAATSEQAGSLVTYDQFTSTTDGVALNATTADGGGTWATSGDATDFIFRDIFSSGAEECLARESNAIEATGRYAVLGSTNYTDTLVEVRSRIGTGGTSKHGPLARWVDASNHLRFTVPAYPSTEAIKLEMLVAGTPTVLASSTAWARAQGVIYRLRLYAYASGRTIAQVLSDAGELLAELEASNAALATGGALATGKPGLYDRTLIAGGEIRRFDDFTVTIPAAEPIVLYSGRTMQITHTEAIRQDSTGTYTGRVPSYKGSRLLVPVGTSRTLVKARRNDVAVATDDNVTDTTQVQVSLSPRGLAVPR